MGRAQLTEGLSVGHSTPVLLVLGASRKQAGRLVDSIPVWPLLQFLLASSRQLNNELNSFLPTMLLVMMVFWVFVVLIETGFLCVFLAALELTP